MRNMQDEITSDAKQLFLSTNWRDSSVTCQHIKSSFIASLSTTVKKNNAVEGSLRRYNSWLRGWLLTQKKKERKLLDFL